MDKEEKERTFTQDQIRFEVTIINDRPFLNVFLEDGSWFALSPENRRVPEGSQCHPEYYKKIWGKPMPTSRRTKT